MKKSDPVALKIQRKRCGHCDEWFDNTGRNAQYFNTRKYCSSDCTLDARRANCVEHYHAKKAITATAIPSSWAKNVRKDFL